MRYVALLFIFICHYASLAMVEFVSARTGWETLYRVAVVNNYSDADLRTHFEALRSQGAVPTHIHDAIAVIIGYPTGKSTISDIVAAVEPKLYYAQSLRAILAYIDARKDNVLTAEEALRVAFGLVGSINPGVLADVGVFNAYIATALAPEWYNKLNTSPESIVQNVYTGNLFTADHVGAANFLYTQLNLAV